MSCGEQQKHSPLWDWEPIMLKAKGLNGITGSGYSEGGGGGGGGGGSAGSGPAAPEPAAPEPAAPEPAVEEAAPMPRAHEPVPPGEVKFLTNWATTHAGLRNPHNTGLCTLVLAGVDEHRNIIRDGSLQLFPGEAVHGYYHAPATAVAIVVSAFDCGGAGELSYDMPLS